MLIERKQKPVAAEKPRYSRPRLFWTSVVYQTKEFFNNSTLHGVRYIGEEGRPVCERFLWLIVTAIGAGAAFVIIASLWEKFQTNPTITGLDTDFHNQQVIFPTIDVCPFAPYDENRTRELAFATLGNYDEDMAAKLEPILMLLTQLSYGLIEDVAREKLKFSKTELKIFSKRTLRALAFMTRISCQQTFDQCKYKDEPIECCDYFFPVYTEHGFCYAFNGQYTDGPNSEEKNTTFHDLFETDKKWALNFQPRSQSRIFVHSSNENFGWDFRPQIEWSPSFSVELLISMKQTYTTEDARQLSIAQRKCIFPDEMRLDIYEGEYTFTSCMKECRLKKCLQLCKCVPPFYRPLASHPYCTLPQFECLAHFVKNITDVKDCQQCELSCSNTVYDIEKLSETGSDQGGMEESSITVEYLTWPIIRYKREVLFGWVDLLVSFGGIAGLFLGFSLLSGVEFFYYFTMRACCMMYKNKDVLYAIEDKRLNRTKGYKLPYTNNHQSSGTSQVILVQAFDVNTADETKKDVKVPKRLNRANLKLQAARELARPRFKPMEHQESKITRNYLEYGQFGYIP